MLAEIKTLPGEERATLENGLLLVTAVDMPAVAPGVLSLLQERGVIFTSVNTPEVNLETVFLQLTGKTLREGYLNEILVHCPQ